MLKLCDGMTFEFVEFVDFIFSLWTNSAGLCWNPDETNNGTIEWHFEGIYRDEGEYSSFTIENDAIISGLSGATQGLLPLLF